MDLKHIKSKACPKCGETEIVKEGREQDYDWKTHSYGKIRRHSCGEEGETREFQCGYVTKWVPNYGKEVCGHGCKGRPEYREALACVEQLEQERTLLEERIRLVKSQAYELIKGVD